jgi:putative transcriptional regulator
MAQTFESFKGKALIAMPHLKDPHFEQSVCYICQHDAEGALGFVINKPLHMLERDLLQDQHLEIPSSEFSRALISGGPLHTDRGFVIHSHPDQWHNTLAIGKNLFVTTSKEILRAIAEKEITDDYLIILGYAAWQPGQLENELCENDWLIGDIPKEFLFQVPVEQRWSLAMQHIGIQHPFHLSDLSGHA